MSRKWQRNKAWEDTHLVGPLAPVRVVLRTFSTIPLAVVLLVFISLYATLASVPIGLIAQLPTYLVHAVMVLLFALVPALLVVAVVRGIIPKQARGARFAITLLGGAGVMVAGVGAWARFVWPSLHYDPATGGGLMFFRDFVETYASTTVRRLPWLEMTETQFYAAWPMKLALWLFVTNMIVTTVRRIEFTFKNLGVLSVHTGIVLIAVGSVFYQRFKQEGDTLLMAAQTPGAIGPPQRAFYDREDVALYVAQHRNAIGSKPYQQRPVRVPLYNNYDLRAGIGEGQLFTERTNPAAPPAPELSAPERAATSDGGRTLSRAVPEAAVYQGQSQFVDPDIRFRVVGFASYAEMRPDWVNAEPRPGGAATPMRTVDLYAQVPGADLPKDRPLFEFPFFLSEPAQRVRSNDFVAVEFTKGMPEARWSSLSAEVPVVGRHALVVEIPESGFRTVIPVVVGQRLDLAQTGWALTVKDLAEEPPFPIITKGYEGATSSLAIVEITPPASAGGVAAEPIERWVYHRFPEIDQDLATTPDPTTGRPARGAPDPRIRVSYLDMTRLQVYLDELEDGSVRAIVRQPGGAVRVMDQTDGPWVRDLVPNTEGASIDLKLNERWAHAKRVERPVPTPLPERDPSLEGSRIHSFLAVEVSLPESSPNGPWSETVWLPFHKYLETDPNAFRTVEIPGGRQVEIAYARWKWTLPGFSVSLADFEMIAYDHRGAPRDYQSVVRVAPTVRTDDPAGDFEAYDHLIKLNAPLRAPFHWDPEGNVFSNVARRLVAGLNPDQFKFSQAGWDRAGWNQSQKLVDEGRLAEPRVSFTILGVGNNPGIHVVAFGGILMGVGTPWAFYVKPWLVRREKQRLAAAAKSGAIKPKGSSKQSKQSGTDAGAQAEVQA